MLKRKQKGVSLLEVVIVLAISAMMLATVFQWLSVRKRTQFTTDMNTLLSGIKGVQTATLANEGPKGDNSTSPCSPINPKDEIVGQAVYFEKANPHKYKLYRLRSLEGNNSVISCYEWKEIALPSSVGYEGTQESLSQSQYGDKAFVVFLRSTNQAYYWNCNPLRAGCTGRQSSGLISSDFDTSKQNNNSDLYLNFKDLNDENFKAKINFNLRNNKVGLSF